MIVYTKWPGLIPAIKRAGHTPVLVDELPAQHEVKERKGMEYLCTLHPEHDALAELRARSKR